MQEHPQDNLEQQIQEYFGEEASRAPLSSGFWPRLRARLDVQSERFGWWHALVARRYILAAAAGVVVLAIVGIFAVPPMLGGGDNPSGPLVGKIASPAATPTPLPSGTFPSPSGPQGPAGPAGPNLTSDFSDGYPGVAFGLDQTTTGTATPAPVATPASTTGSNAPSDGAQLDAIGRSVITQSGLAIEVDDVPAALDQTRSIANSAGGFIQSLSTSGGADPDKGSVTVRVPGAQYTDALAKIKALGTVTGETVSSDDVTNQAIDLQARLTAAQAEEASYLNLLDQATTVNNIIQIQTQLSSVRTTIEQIQGQLNYLNERVNYATINVNFGKPAAAVTTTAKAPYASLTAAAKNVDDALAQAKDIVKQAGGEIDNTTVSLRSNGPQAVISFRVPPAKFDGVLSQVQQLGTVTAQQINEPGTNGATPSTDAIAKMDVTFNQAPAAARNWWLLVGAPVGGVVGLALIAYGAFWIGRRKPNEA